MKLEDMTFEYEYADASDISYRVLKKLNSLGMRPIRVPIRQTGLSSQGDYLHCHVNVKKMVSRYGGKRLIGHTVGEHDKDCFEVFGHSVWITPENKVVCISKKNWTKQSFHYDKDYLVFIPRMIDETPDKDEEIINIDFMVIKNKIATINPDEDERYKFHEGTTLKNANNILDVGIQHNLGRMRKNNIFLEKRNFKNLLRKYFYLAKEEGLTAWRKV